MESLNPKLALYGSINKCTRTSTVLPPISEVSTGAVSFSKRLYTNNVMRQGGGGSLQKVTSPNLA